MTDMVAAEFIPWKNDRLVTRNLSPSTKPIPKLNAIGMTYVVAAEFIPWKKRSIGNKKFITINQTHPENKCQRHDRYGSCGIYSVENDRLITRNLSPSSKPIPKLNAVGMTDIVAAEFIPWETINPGEQTIVCQKISKK